MKTTTYQNYFLFSCACLLCIALFSSGCGQKPDSNENTIQINKNFTIELVPVSKEVLFVKDKVTPAQWKTIMGNDNISRAEYGDFLKKFNSLPTVQESGFWFSIPSNKDMNDACRMGVVNSEDWNEAWRLGVSDNFSDYFGLYLCAVHSEIPNIIAGMVSIPGQQFKIGKTEVTQAQWEHVMGENPAWNYGGKSKETPVEFVSHQDCETFLVALNSHSLVKKSGLWFRLPKVEEWEYACHAGSTGNFCKIEDGTEIQEDTLDRVAWLNEDPDYGHTHLVGQKAPNAFGLYDMLGNVWELTDTWTEGKTGKCLIVCGGSSAIKACYFDGTPWRHKIVPFRRGKFTGFRLCAEEINSKTRKERLEAFQTRQRSEESRENPISTIISDMKKIPGKDFMMCRTEVTQKQWEAVMRTESSFTEFDSNKPVACIRWYDCFEFVRRLNHQPEVKKADLVFRLPMKEEWEYACRAGAKGNYCKLADGQEITRNTIGDVAWFAENSNQSTSPVGKNKPNAFGLCDMLGNVWEWTTGRDNSAWVCGGGYSSPAEQCSAVRQDKVFGTTVADGIGFRLCAEKQNGRSLESMERARLNEWNLNSEQNP